MGQLLRDWDLERWQQGTEWEPESQPPLLLLEWELLLELKSVLAEELSRSARSQLEQRQEFLSQPQGRMRLIEQRASPS